MQSRELTAGMCVEGKRVSVQARRRGDGCARRSASADWMDYLKLKLEIFNM